MISKRKVGRNDPCPCGSGRKYKKCHLNTPSPETIDRANLMFQKMDAKEFQRKEQQGLGKPIISTDANGVRVVAIGSDVLYSDKWKTFPDFLFDYIIKTLGRDWYKEEAIKSQREQHTIIQWFNSLNRLRNEADLAKGEIGSLIMTGECKAYLDLSYNLYLLQHNEGVQSEIIRRLKISDQSNFYGAFYETFVAANFIKAGFDIEFEDEQDGTTTHCEFTATHQKTRRQFSVEAKAMMPFSKKKPVIGKLKSALKKNAKHQRIVFIEVSKFTKSNDEGLDLLKDCASKIKKLQSNPNLGGVTLPEAYVFITNHSFWCDLKGYNNSFYLGIEGFKIPSFNHDFKGTIRELRIQRDNNKEPLDLAKSIIKYHEVPSTFEGENPILNGASNEEPRFIIGKKYLVPKNGKDMPAKLDHAFVSKSSKEAVCAYNFDGGGASIGRFPLSDQEFTAYKKHPQTFFGKVQSKGKSESLLDFYDWVYGNFKNNSKENLLEMMKESKDIESLKKENQEELAKIYCERVAASAWFENHKKNK